MAEHEASPTVPPSRSAKFKRHPETEMAPTDMTLGRRAEFRPSEQIAVRRDVIEEFRKSLMRDVTGVGDCDEIRRRSLFAAALAEEAMRSPDRAALQLSRLRRESEFWPDEWAVVRRVHRRLGDDDVVADALERAYAVSRGVEKAMVGLERARHDWDHGAPPRRVASWVRRVLQEFDGDGRRALHRMPRFTAAWAVQLATDAAVEADHFDRALTLLDAFLDHPELNARDRQLIAATLGLWHYALGDREPALSYLAAVGGQGELASDFEDAWLHLLFGESDRAGALKVMRRSAEVVREEGPRAVVLALLESGAGDDERGADVLRGARQQRDDAVVLDVSLELLESVQAREELIDVLNQRLGVEVDTDRRAALLARLGRLYEAEARLDEAAADVYREALELVPDYAPAIRALGRLYARQKSWSALVELYEHEIETLSGPTVWRRRYQVARLYEFELEDYERALAQYRAVLESRPSYLPALKGVARILTALQRWSELADAFLQAAGTAVSTRQKLYLLDRVAEVSEQKLGRWDVAIGAWEEILHMDRQHPRAFSSLGRLYARTERWHELIDLNERELELVEDHEEAAALLVRNAEIAEHHLGRPDLAEHHYGRVLERLPDYLPALEGMGRIYARGERWGEIVQMTDAQLSATEDNLEVKRQLGALAEIFEGQLERHDDAIRVYERFIALDPNDGHAYHNLLRLYRIEERWQAAFDLIERQRRPGFEGQLGRIAEWRLNQWDVAFRWYLEALESDPAEQHWLEAVSRLWQPARVEPGELADRLEGLLMAPMSADVRDRYFIILARLREASEGTPDAGRAYRAHGDTDNLESLIVLRLAMAANGEREALGSARRTHPVLPWDVLVNADRLRPDEDVVAQFAELDDEERRFLVRETSLRRSRSLVRAGDGAWTELAAEMQRILSAPPSVGGPREGDVPEMLRLMAVEALAADDVDRFVEFTLAECEKTPSRELQVHRLIEVAREVTGEERHQFLERATRVAFDELSDDELQMQRPADGPVFDRLYDALQDNLAWGLLRTSLDAHVERDALSDARRCYLLEMLAGVCEDQLDEFPAAREARERCWEISAERRFLRDLVRISREEGDIDLAVDWQQRHFDAVVASDSTPEQRIQSALWLAELLRIAGRGDEAVETLEARLEDSDESPLGEELQRELARLHTDFGEPRRASELFQDVLTFHAAPDDVDDWRTLIRLQRNVLDDPATAYSLQWKLVRSLPTSQRDLDDLVDFALDLDEIADCCEQLEQFAGELEGEARIAVLGRAAIALDEDLNWAEEASRLYQELLDELEDDEASRKYRRRYAFCLARIAGREADALEEFRALVRSEPFEPSTYRGLVDLLERTQAYDRARVAKQVLVSLGCEVDDDVREGKTTPSREFEPRHVEELLLPEGLREGVLGALRAAMPMAEKIWADELPQRKALDGNRVKDGPVFEAVADAMVAFGIRKFKLMTGDAGPLKPQVFPDGSVWINDDLLRGMGDHELRFVAGYCAALAWSDISSLLALDGRRIWHLLEGVLFRQTDRGFGDRIDQESQRLGGEVSGPFYAVARRRVSQALDVAGSRVAQSHCEAWPNMVEDFAHHVGLVLAGDVPASVSALLKLGGWDAPLEDPTTQSRLRRSSMAEELLRFAFTDAFLVARHTVGLAGRPSSLSV